jgi:hypothetical protein
MKRNDFCFVSAGLLLAASFVLTGALVGCTSKTVQNPAAPRQLVFPYGTYQHDIDVQITARLPPDVAFKAKDQPKEFHFRGAVLISEKQIKVVALSAMGTTIFRITEDRASGNVETEIYVDALKKIESHMVEYYGVIKEVLTTPLPPSASGTQGPLHITKQTPAGLAEIDFKDYDKNGIPTTVDVENSKFNLQIKVLGYEI